MLCVILGEFRRDRVDQVHEEQALRVLDTEHGPRMAARALSLAAGEHYVLVPPASYADWGRDHRISGCGPRVRFRRRSQVQGMGVRAQVLRDR